MKDFDPNMLVVTLTIEQFFNIQKQFLSSYQETINNETKKLLNDFLESDLTTKSEKRYVYGLKGLAKVLDVSKSKAMNIKSSGILDEAIYQNGRLIKIDAELAIDLFYKNKDKDEL